MSEKDTLKQKRQNVIKKVSVQKQLAPPKLKLLFTIVNREKTELYTALIQSFEVNMQLSAAARGTASEEMLRMLGLSDKNKALIMSVIREDTEDTILKFLNEKFHTIKKRKRYCFYGFNVKHNRRCHIPFSQQQQMKGEYKNGYIN